MKWVSSGNTMPGARMREAEVGAHADAVVGDDDLRAEAVFAEDLQARVDVAVELEMTLADFEGDPGFEGQHVDFDVHVAAKADVARFVDVEVLFGDLVAEQFAGRVRIQFERGELNRQGSADAEQRAAHHVPAAGDRAFGAEHRRD